jgi:hypothetical protein
LFVFFVSHNFHSDLVPRYPFRFPSDMNVAVLMCFVDFC